MCGRYEFIFKIIFTRNS